MLSTTSDNKTGTIQSRDLIKAVAVIPGKPNTIHLRDVPKPRVADVPGGRGVLVKILKVGVDGTDKEINAAEYGAPPSRDDYLIVGHESFGRIDAVGPNVSEFSPGDYVALTVRRPGSSLYDQIGTYDMTTDDTYFERGINLRHGFLTEYVVDHPEYIIRVPENLKEVGVLMEPMSVAQKAIEQAYRIQQRLRVWRPRRAAVLGSGTLGLLSTLVLRLRGLDVTTFGNTTPPFLNSRLIEELGARYVSTKELSLTDASAKYGPFDLILEGTGYSPLVFEAMNVLAKLAKGWCEPLFFSFGRLAGGNFWGRSAALAAGLTGSLTTSNQRVTTRVRTRWPSIVQPGWTIIREIRDMFLRPTSQW